MAEIESRYKKPENYEIVKEALLKAGRADLIGFGPECLIPPRQRKQDGFVKSKQNAKGNHGASKKSTNAKFKSGTSKRQGTLKDGSKTGKARKQETFERTKKEKKNNKKRRSR